MRLKTRLFYAYVLSLILYSAIVLIPKPSPAVLFQYHVTAERLRLIEVTIIILLAAIWFSLAMGMLSEDAEVVKQFESELKKLTTRSQ